MLFLCSELIDRMFVFIVHLQLQITRIMISRYAHRIHLRICLCWLVGGVSFLSRQGCHPVGHCSAQPLTVMFKKSYHQDKEITSRRIVWFLEWQWNSKRNYDKVCLKHCSIAFFCLNDLSCPHLLRLVRGAQGPSFLQLDSHALTRFQDLTRIEI